MATLTSQQLKDSYQSLVTIGDSITSDPTSGVLENGKGTPITDITIGGDITIADKIIHSGDTNTAIRFPSADTVSIETGGSERLRVDSSGNLGINAIAETSAGTWRNYQLGSLSMASRASNAVPDGMVGTNFKFTTANAEQRISAHATSRIFFNDDVITFQNAGSDTAGSTISWNERMRIDSSGNVLVGITSFTTGSGGGLSMHPTTNGRTLLYCGTTVTTSSAVQAFVNPNGQVGTISTNGSATAYNTSSDYRLKENVIPMQGALDRVAQLKPSTFNFIADADTTVDGFLAHEVQEIVPNAVNGEKDAVDEEGNPMYQGIDHSKLVPILVGAIQELKAEIEQLKNQ